MEFADLHMCARTDLFPLEKFDQNSYWLTECKELLKEKCRGDGNKWDRLEEDMYSWEPIACLSILIHARTSHEQQIFQSPMVNFCDDEREYEFSALSKKIKLIRNKDSHSASIEDITLQYDEDMYLILQFLSDLKCWYEKNDKSDGCKALVSTNNALLKVREDYNHLFENSVSQWTDIYARLNKLDPNEAS